MPMLDVRCGLIAAGEAKRLGRDAAHKAAFLFGLRTRIIYSRAHNS